MCSCSSAHTESALEPGRAAREGPCNVRRPSYPVHEPALPCSATLCMSRVHLYRDYRKGKCKKP
jgi:hypothetical protein